MPRQDHSGPQGGGPMSGHGRGLCLVPVEEAELRCAELARVGIAQPRETERAENAENITSNESGGRVQ